MKLLLSATGAPLRVRAACRRHNKIILLISNARYFIELYSKRLDCL